MKALRILGITILIGGIVCILFSNYITKQVNEGKIQIEQGQKAVDTTNQLFSVSPYTKPVGKGLTSSSQKKINEGQNQVDHYEAIARTLQIWGIVAIIAGAVMFIISFFGKRKKRR